MLIDLHMHESTYSSDSVLKLEDMVALAKQRGLDGICITDHDSMGLRDFAADYARRTGFPIFVGVEFYSLQGDIVAFGIDAIPKQRIDAQTFVDFVHAAGGICISAHPFRSNNRGLDQNLPLIQGLDGIEVFNASTDYDSNLRALDHCRRLNIRPVGASDCHVKEKLGRFATRFPACADTLETLLQIFRAGDTIPVGYLNGRYMDLISGSSSLTCTISREMHNQISLQQDYE